MFADSSADAWDLFWSIPGENVVESPIPFKHVVIRRVAPRVGLEQLVSPAVSAHQQHHPSIREQKQGCSSNTSAEIANPADCRFPTEGKTHDFILREAISHCSSGDEADTDGDIRRPQCGLERPSITSVALVAGGPRSVHAASVAQPASSFAAPCLPLKPAGDEPTRSVESTAEAALMDCDAADQAAHVPLTVTAERLVVASSRCSSSIVADNASLRQSSHAGAVAESLPFPACLQHPADPRNPEQHADTAPAGASGPCYPQVGSGAASVDLATERVAALEAWAPAPEAGMAPWSAEALRMRLPTRDPRLLRNNGVNAASGDRLAVRSGTAAAQLRPALAPCPAASLPGVAEQTSVAAADLMEVEAVAAGLAAGVAGPKVAMPVAPPVAPSRERTSLPPLRRGPSTTTSRLLARLRPSAAAATLGGSLPRRTDAGIAAPDVDLQPRRGGITKKMISARIKQKPLRGGPEQAAPPTAAAVVALCDMNGGHAGLVPDSNRAAAGDGVIHHDPRDNNSDFFELNGGLGRCSAVGAGGAGFNSSILDDLEAALEAAEGVRPSLQPAGNDGAKSRQRGGAGGRGEADRSPVVWLDRRAWTLPPLRSGRFDFPSRKRRGHAVAASGPAVPSGMRRAASAGGAAAAPAGDAAGRSGEDSPQQQQCEQELRVLNGEPRTRPNTAPRPASVPVTKPSMPAPTVTATGAGSSRGQKRPTPDPTPKPSLFDALDAWRKARARSIRKTPGALLRNDLLQALVERCPTSVLRLEDVPGLGRPWIRQYGQEVLDVCRNFVHVQAAAAANKAARMQHHVGAAEDTQYAVPIAEEGPRGSPVCGDDDEGYEPVREERRGDGGGHEGPCAARRNTSSQQDVSTGKAQCGRAKGGRPELRTSSDPPAKRRRRLAPHGSTATPADRGLMGPDKAQLDEAQAAAAWTRSVPRLDAADTACDGGPVRGVGGPGPATGAGGAFESAAPRPAPAAAGASSGAGFGGMSGGRLAGAGDARARMRRHLLQILGLTDGPSLDDQLLSDRPPPGADAKNDNPDAAGAPGPVRRRRRLVRGPPGAFLGGNWYEPAAAAAAPDADYSFPEDDIPAAGDQPKISRAWPTVAAPPAPAAPDPLVDSNDGAACDGADSSETRVGQAPLRAGAAAADEQPALSDQSSDGEDLGLTRRRTSPAEAATGPDDRSGGGSADSGVSGQSVKPAPAGPKRVDGATQVRDRGEPVAAGGGTTAAHAPSPHPPPTVDKAAGKAGGKGAGKKRPAGGAAKLAQATLVASVPTSGWTAPPPTCRVRPAVRLAYAHTPLVHAIRINDLLSMLAEAGRAAEPFLEELPYAGLGASADIDGAAATVQAPLLSGGRGRMSTRQQHSASQTHPQQRPQGPGGPGLAVEPADGAAAPPARGVVLPAAAVAAAAAAQRLGRLPGQESMRRLRLMATAALPAWEVRRVLACRALAPEAQAAAVLRVSHGVSRDEVRVAFKRMSLLVHPDKNRSVGAAEAFSLVSAAANKMLGKPT